MHDGKLLLVGGVWLHSAAVPGVTVIDLMTGISLEYQIDTVSTEITPFPGGIGVLRWEEESPGLC